ncbi:MAG: hypothetical protein QT04_C0008G0019, partial [archaeon GW2011_AR11]
IMVSVAGSIVQSVANAHYHAFVNAAPGSKKERAAADEIYAALEEKVLSHCDRITAFPVSRAVKKGLKSLSLPDQLRYLFDRQLHARERDAAGLIRAVDRQVYRHMAAYATSPYYPQHAGTLQ